MSEERDLEPWLSASPGSEDRSVASPSAAAPAANELGLPVSGRYGRGGLLGRGGMGEVHVAFDSVLRREIALKLPRDATHAQALIAEARLAARLEHPSIVPIHDAGLTPEGRFFYAMRIVRGGDLEERVRETPHGPQRMRLVRLLLQATQAVAYAHSRDVLHRDLSARNVRLGEHGEVWVLDWGLGLVTRAEAPEESAGSCGTPGYQAPEVLRGERATAASDVWSLGALLHEALGGPGDPRRDPLRRAPLPRWVPRPLAAVVKRCLEPDSGRRYADAAELASDLNAFLSGQPVAAFRERPHDALARIARRNPSLLISLVAGALLVMAAVSVFGALALRARDQSEDARSALEGTLAQMWLSGAREALLEDRSEEAERLARRALALRDEPEAHGILAALRRLPRISWVAAAEPSPRKPSDRAITQKGGLIELRGEPRRPSSLRFTNAEGQVEREFATRFGGAGQLVRARAQGWTAAIFSDGALLVDDSGGAAKEVTPCPLATPVRAAVWEESSVAPTLWVACAGGALRKHREGQTIEEVMLPLVLRGAVALAMPAPDRLVVGTIEGTVGVLEPSSSRLLRAARVPVGAIRELSVVGEEVVRISGEGGELLWRWTIGASLLTPASSDGVALGPLIAEFELPATAPVHHLRFGAGLSALALAPDGKTLAFGDGEGSVHLVDVTSGALRTRRGPSQVVKSLAFSADGGELAVGAAGPEGVTLLRTADLSARSGPWEQPAAGEAERPRGRFVGFRSGQLFVFNWGDGQYLYRLLEPVAALEPTRLTSPIRDALSDHRDGSAWILHGEGRLTRWSSEAPVERAAPAGTRSLALAPSGLCLALFGSDWLELRDARSDSVTKRLQFTGAPLEAVALDGACARVALGRRDGRIEVIDATTGRQELSLVAHRQRVAALVFGPEGEWLASASWDGEARVLGLPALRDSPPSTLRSRTR